MIRERVVQVVAAALEKAHAEGALPEAAPGSWSVETPRDRRHGDFATNAAMVLARAAKRPPREVAGELARRLPGKESGVEKVEIAGPGFLNLTLCADVFHQAMGEVFRAGPQFGHSGVGGGARTMVEFVSANPTGPMHIGHGRGAVVGDVLASLLAAAGWEVTREYYINDAGAQVKTLGRSVHLRYRELFGQKIEFPEGAYPGEYVIDIAKKLRARDGDRWLFKPEEEWLEPVTDFAIGKMMEAIKSDLAALGIRFDTFFSERTLHAEKRIDQAILALTAKGEMYEGVLEPPKDKSLAEDWEPRPQLLFRATAHGDDQDRALKKSDGSYTYFAADIAYHHNKLERGFEKLINVWGADHGGYVKRVQAAVEALTGKKGAVEVLLVQMVNLTRGGQPVRMSKRAGTFVTLREVVDEVGKDATRVFFLQRRHDAQLDFDLELAKRQSLDNPVYYVQYGHARIASILRRALEQGVRVPPFQPALLSALTLPEEQDLEKRIVSWPDVVAGAALAREPHRIVFWLTETIGAFHAYYTKYAHTERVISPDPDKTAARLLLVAGLKQVLANALGLLGVDAPERMERAEAD